MAFKDNFRIEKIYFQRVKDDAQILGSWKNDPRRYSREEIVRVAKDACDSILMLYRLLGECWNDALNQIERLKAELEALAGKTEAYHDELNEKIDEVNNYLNTQIKNLEIRVENIENSIEAFGGLPSNENAEEGDVLTVGENHVNEWKKPNGGVPHYYFGFRYDSDTYEYSVLSDEIDLPTEPLYIGVPFEISEGGQTATITIIEHTDKIPVLALFEYLRGEALISAYVLDENNNVSYADMVKLDLDLSVGRGKITFNLTSKNHCIQVDLSSSPVIYQPAKLLTYDLFPLDASQTIIWETYFGSGVPVIDANLL